MKVSVCVTIVRSDLVVINAQAKQERWRYAFEHNQYSGQADEVGVVGVQRWLASTAGSVGRRVHMSQGPCQSPCVMPSM